MSGMLWMGGAALLRAVIQIVVLSILARLLTPSEFGVVGAALLVVAFSQLFSRLGVGQIVVQTKHLELRHTQTGFYLATAANLVMAGIVWLLAPWAAEFFGAEDVQPVLRALALLFPIRGVAIVAEAQVRRDLRFRLLATTETTSLALGYAPVGIVAALNGFGVWALVAAQLAQATLQSAMLLLAHSPSLRPFPDRRTVQEFTGLGGGFTAGSVANYAATQGDNVLVGHLLGPADLGLYGRAYQMMAMPANLFGDVLDVVLFPAMARVQDSRRTLGKAYRRGVAAVALVTAPASITLAALGEELVHVLLGPQWEGAVLPFQILAAGTLFRTSYKMSESISRATAAVYRRAWRQTVYAALVIGGALIGQRWGIAGVASAVLLALAVNYLLMAHLSLKLASLTWLDFWRAHAAALRLMVLAAGLAFLVRLLLVGAGAGPGLTLMVAGLTSAAAALLATWKLPRLFLGAEGEWIVRSLRGYLPQASRAA